MIFVFTLLLLGTYLFFPEWMVDNILNVSGLMTLLLIGAYLKELGKQLLIIEILPIMTIVFYLVAPAMSYYLEAINWYEGNATMPIESMTYFEVAIPCALMLILGVHFPRKHTINHLDLFEKVKIYLTDKQIISKQLIIIGLASLVLKQFAPDSLGLIFQFGSELILVGGLYLFFGSNKDWLALSLIGVYLLGKSVSGGMFGELIVWGMMFAIYYFLKKPWRLISKIVGVCLGLFLVVVLQSVKWEYRKLTWFGDETTEQVEESNLSIFWGLMAERFADPSALNDPLVLGNILERFNQGYLTASAIEHTPAIEPFANGETVSKAILAAFVPRFLWPQKPEAGGRENIARFTNIELVGKTSMNIGQLGEAYVNFGAWGGAILMFLYGFFSMSLFQKGIEICKKRPSIIFWLPFLFSNTIIVETDLLTTFNHLFKAIIFIWIVHESIRLFYKNAEKIES